MTCCWVGTFRFSAGGDVGLLAAGASERVRVDTSGVSRAKSLKKYSVMCFAMIAAFTKKDRSNSDAGRPVSKMFTFRKLVANLDIFR